jgi:hypothetical protein
VKLTLDHTDHGTVARLDCPPRQQPTWLTIKHNEAFYIRAASASELLSPSMAASYIKEHWK